MDYKQSWCRFKLGHFLTGLNRPVPLCSVFLHSDAESDPADAVGVDGQGLLEAQEIAKRVYRVATWIVQRAGLAVHSVIKSDVLDAADERDVSLPLCFRAHV